MQSLCEAVCTHRKKDRLVDEMDLDVLDRRDRDRRLEKESLEVIDRYRRMDEWASSYHNLYSRTALDCQRRLSDNRIGKVGAMHFLQYTRPGNYDMLRLTAFENLSQPSVLQNPAVLRYMTFCMSSDPSPWIRASLWRSFGKLLAVVAIGDHLKAHQLETTDELVIENDAGAANQQAQAARKRAVDAAIAALKEEIGDNEDLARALWDAVNSNLLALHELQAMLDFCRMLYDPVDSLVVKLHYPRYWRVQYEGKVSLGVPLENKGEVKRLTTTQQGKLKFSRTKHVRTKAFVKWVPKAPSPVKKYDLLPPKTSGTKVVFKSLQPLQPTSQPPPVVEESTPRDAVSQPRQTLKLKLSGPRPAAG
jgi:transcription initiation factor TFIID subunit 2